MSHRGVVYHLFNVWNGKAYVGQTWRGLNRRWVEHKCLAKKVRLGRVKVSVVDPVIRAIAKHRPESFVVTQLCECLTQEQMNEAETYFVDHFQSRITQYGYNVREPGSNGELAESTKRKISEKLMGRKLSNEQRKAISEGLRTNRVYGPASEEAKRKMSLAHFGKRLSPEHAEKIRQAHIGMKYKKRSDTGKHRTSEQRSRMKEAQRLRRLRERCLQ